MIDVRPSPVVGAVYVPVKVGFVAVPATFWSAIPVEMVPEPLALNAPTIASRFPAASWPENPKA